MPLKQQLFLFEPPYLSSWSDIPGWLETVILKHECYYETRGPQNIISLPSRWIIQVTSQPEYLLLLSLMQCFVMPISALCILFHLEVIGLCSMQIGMQRQRVD